MIQFRKRAAIANPARVAVLPGAFNPPTVAHLALVEAALQEADEVLLVMAEQMPHKQYAGASFEQRMEMLLACAAAERISVGSSSGGLFLDIARSCRQAYGNAQIAILCGKDAAERILTWPYEEPGVLDRLFADAELWVYARGGSAGVPERHSHAIRCLNFDEGLQALSASEVRRKVSSGEQWRHLVPREIHEMVEAIYGSGRPGS